ncbi:MAG TPA: hypothetical protein VEA69_06650, partial [Tepidisphaeraceae bacterium]|nr:hypothetical protein [Tepidisphaeraceae bacterium]
GVSGIKKFTFDNGNGHVNRSAYLAAQSDGKIVLVGTAKRAGADAFAQDIAVLRLNADGTPDASFGNNGQVIRTGGAGGNFATDLVIQPDGKILVAGGNMVAVQTGMGDGYTGGAGFVWRLNADGSTDTSFGNGGTVSLGTPAGTHGVVERIALAPDGTIVGVSNAWNGNDVPPATVVYKLNAADGSPVGNGGTGTIVATGRGINRILVAPDAKIYLAGLTRDGAPAQDGPLDFDVIRLNADLSLDTSFANAGDFRTSFGPTGADDQATALALTADGKLIVAGVAPDASATVHGGDLAVLRLDLGAPAANPQSRRSPKRIAMEQAAQQSTTGSKRSPKRIALEEAAKSATGSKRSPKRVAMETAAIEQAIADARAAGSTRSAKQIAHDALAMFSTTRIS